MTLRQRKQTALREKLVHTAARLFALKGYGEVSIDEIVEVAMCSRSTFHRYFGTKEDILFPTAQSQLDSLRKRLSTAPADESPWTILRREVSSRLSQFLDDFDPELRKQCVELWYSEPALRKRYSEIVFDWEDAISDFLARRLRVAAEDALLKSLLAAMVTSVLRSALQTAMKTDIPVDILIDRAFSAVEGGVIQILTSPTS